jgi:ATP-dependent Clp protease ATP-binding subunit ClpC
MFERYTESAPRDFFARYEASMYGSPFIETEHVLLGLLRQSPDLEPHLVDPGAKLQQECTIEVEIRSRFVMCASIACRMESRDIFHFLREILVAGATFSGGINELGLGCEQLVATVELFAPLRHQM